MGGAEPVGEGADCIDVLQIGQAVADARAAGRCRDRVPGTLRPAMIAGQEMDRRPRLASATAAAWPIPDVAPVMTTVRPSAEGWSSTVNSGSRADRTGRPVRRNPGPRRPLVRRPPPARSGHGAPPRRRPAGPNRCARWRRGPRTGGRPDRAWARPAAARTATAETWPRGGGEHLECAPQPHLGVIAGRRAVRRARYYDPVRSLKHAIGSVQEHFPVRHEPDDLIGQGHAHPPGTAPPAGSGLSAPAGPESSCSPASTPRSQSAALLKIARYPTVSVAERRDSTAAW